MMRRRAMLWIVTLCLVASGMAVADPDPAADRRGHALKPDPIRSEPFIDAKPVGELAKDDPVEIVGKEGGWLRIKCAKGEGWVRLLSVRRAESVKAGYTAEGILALASGRAGTGKVVATTGIRGLSEEDLQAARFNAGQVVILESYLVTRGQAREFAGQGRLSARSVPYLAGEGTR